MKNRIMLCTACALTSLTAQADVRVNGFANIIGGITSSDDQVFNYDDRISFSEESLFAIQVVGDVNDKITATGQIVARGANDYNPDFEWAYLTYQLNEKLSISAGRLRLPLFNYSSSLDVGYSHHWVSPPRAVYDVPFNNLEGLTIDYASFAGDWEYNLSASFGTYEGEVGETPSLGNNVQLYSAEAIYDWFKLRLVIGQSKTSFPLLESNNEGFLGAGLALNALAATGFSELESQLQIADDTGTFAGLSIQVDKYDWFISGEYTDVRVEQSFTSEDSAYYLTAGLRFGKWTPSITYEKAKGDINTRFNGQIAALTDVELTAAQIQNFVNTPFGAGVNALSPVSLTQLPVEIAGPAVTEGLAEFARGLILSGADESEVWSATIRYDYDTNIALKADISRFSNNLNNEEDGTLLRVGANYVF